MSKVSPSQPHCIRVRGARQHNLKNLSLDIPHHQLTVVTGLSGSGKSSLAFDTLYAEGQRRYVETFSPYTRQFLERMDKPDFDSIEGIPPAIAIEQANPVKTSRSTVGTMTEIADYLKMLFARVATLTCPDCGRAIKPYTAQEIAQNVLTEWKDKELLVTFRVSFEKKPTLLSALAALKQQGYLRVWSEGRVFRTDDEVDAKTLAPAELYVIQDRLAASEANRTRLTEAIETALRTGQGIVHFLSTTAKVEFLRFANTWRCPYDGTTFPEPSPALFSFNNPVGACPVCRGFGRTIEIDYERALPDRSLTIAGGLVKPWQSGFSIECQKDLVKHCRKNDIPLDVPFNELCAADQKFIVEGELAKGRSLQDIWENGGWYGVKGYFQWLETKTYKMHVRVFLSRYRAYRTCPTCHGQRLKPEALRFQIGTADHKLNLAAINLLSLRDAKAFIESLPLSPVDEASAMLRREVLQRLSYLLDVGLGYLTLDRPTRTLSGGEVQRVNLTSCLGNALVNTLFVLDEPSIGLHPRDTQQLVDVIHQLRDRGNTLLVVEHEEALMRNADHIIDLGPGRGELGGSLVFAGSYPELIRDKKSLTGKYLRNETAVPVAAKRRAVNDKFQLKLRGASAHNIKDLDLDIPLGLFVGISGVSGSGKSTLVHDVIYRTLGAKNADSHGADDDGSDVLPVKELKNAELISEVIRVDQSPLSKTPRSNPALYLGIYDRIRKIFSETEKAQAQGLTPGDFSFNGGTGRCPRCSGMGYERIEMQFLADVFVTCPVCEGKRFLPHILNVTYRDRSIHDVLNMTVREAQDFFAPDDPAIARALALLTEVGLDYLRLGQPLNQLSGGEAQRIKLLSYLADAATSEKNTPTKSGSTRLFILDEPTTGLHFEDIRLLVAVLQRLVDQGNSLLVIEHNLDVLKCADWLIDLGPEAGDGGGEVVATGTPEQVTRVAKSYTGKFLREKLGVPDTKSTLVLSRPDRKRRAILNRPECIQIRGARHHNLKNVSLDIDLGQMTVVTGLSGSGKSTLAFDLLFAEGQRRYLDSLNAYARQFVEQMEKPAVDSITGIPPAVAIEQRLTQGGRKSTIATVTEIHQFLRLLYAKLGTAHDPETGEQAVRQTSDEIFKWIEKSRRTGELTLLAPLIRARKGFHTEIAKWAQKKGYTMLRVDGKWIAPDKFKALNRYSEHTIDLVVGTLTSKQKPGERRRLVETALEIGRGTLFAFNKKDESVYSTHLFCPKSGRSFDELDPRLFSYNSPHGWCPTCEGYGTILHVNVDAETDAEREAAQELAREWHEEELPVCTVCNGQRLNPIARAVRLAVGKGRSQTSWTLPEISALTILEAGTLFKGVAFSGRDGEIARDILPEIQQRLAFLAKVGLGYLTLDRSAPTLSGGESQRIRLAAQLGSSLQGVLYVLDEPTIGLHPRDNHQLLRSLSDLRDHGNTLVIVEHDEDTMRAADHIIDLGPGAGTHGGNVVAQGSWQQLAKNKKSITGQLLGEPLRHPLSGARRPLDKTVRWCTVKGAHEHNLQNLEVALPAGRLIAVCGVSGAGKSTLVHDVLKLALAPRKRGESATKTSRQWKSVDHGDLFSAVYEVDQSPIGKTSRSTPATYIGLMDDIRSLFAQLPLARQRGYGRDRFSFNSGSGRCQTCLGQGTIKVEMNFLPSVYVPCEACRSRRYNTETLEVKYNEKSIADILDMTIEEAALFFADVPRLQRPLQLLADTGLGYLTLGQRSPTLSGGESQRIKLVAELSRSLGTNVNKRLKMPGFGKTHHLYLLEEPTIGLHLADVKRLLDVMHQLVDAGHTVVVIEHHLDVLAEADYVIELGPEGGNGGGLLIATGTPEQVAKNKKSVTGPFLAKALRA
ncbi:MAG: excinuclease ABC subunit A [Verrucomicrobia bacterium Tous-C9LFEB]|nr:MAG: excinuclease ABC subunit A [Verrucomicrobia bacterium Tous-C9LFEB]